MKQWNFKAIALGCFFLFTLAVARMGVTIGRMVYSIQTGVNVVSEGELPSWQELLLSDGFLYVGAAALLAGILAMLLDKKHK
jgi:hypothetical protein